MVLLCVVALSAISGCATSPKLSLPSGDGQAAQSRLYDLPYWKAEGRLGVKASEGAWNANLFWEHEKAQDRVRISGPFNQGGVSIILQDDLIYINEGNGVTELAHDPRASLKRRLGFEVPVESLRYWMLGLPAPDDAAILAAAGGSASRGFVQQGWTMSFERFEPFAGGEVPKKISLTGNRVKLKLIIDSWMERQSP